MARMGGCISGDWGNAVQELKTRLARQTDGTTVQLSPKQAGTPTLWRADIQFGL
ncbi:MAG: hypothetical protein P8X95_26875 [Anaerolineales bacterium]|jgi:hypothetical protein